MTGTDAESGAASDPKDLVARARTFAIRAHEGHTRKGSDEPEVSHPLAVAELVAAHGHAPHVVAAAVLHDVIEDTDVSEAELRREFPDDVCDLVVDLTEPPAGPDRRATWQRRKEHKLARLADAADDALVICAADRLHNLESLLAMLQARGLDAFAVFSRGPERTLWFEREVERVLARRLDAPLVDAYRKALRSLEAKLDALSS